MNENELTKELIYDLYWDKGMSIKQISYYLELGASKIGRFMIKNNIKRRNKSELMIKKTYMFVGGDSSG